MNQIKINKLIAVVTRKEGYQDSYTRSYNMNVDLRALNSLENILDRSGGNGMISEASIVREIPNIMNISAVPLGISQIANGWGTQRLRFIMEVESNNTGINMVNYVQGYSEFHDPSVGGHMDPHMTFYINSIATVTRTLDPHTNRFIVKPHSNFNLITDHFNARQYQEVTDVDLKLIRPTDIMSNISHIQKFGDENSSVYNFIGNVDKDVSVSERNNHNPVKHFTKTVNSYIDSKNMTGIGFGDADIINAASNNITESNILAVPFIAALHGLTGIDSPSTFTLDQLHRLDPGIADKITVLGDSTESPVNTTMLDTANTEVLYKSTHESVIASTLAHSISGLLIDNLLSEIDFTTSNLSGRIVTGVGSVKSFIEGMDITSYVNKVISNIDCVLMPEVTQNGLLGVELFIHSSVLGDTTIAVSLNGAHSIVFRYPTFADSLYSPVISDEANKNMFADDFNTVISTASNVANAHSPQEQINY